MNWLRIPSWHATPAGVGLAAFLAALLATSVVPPFAGWGGASSASAQSSLERAMEAARGPQRVELQSPQTTANGQVTWSVETPVDPQRYHIVAGDQLLLGIWGESPLSQPVSVTPQGEMVVPKVGPFPVAGITLAEAEALAIRELTPFFPRSRITLGLVAPGRFRVSVVGMVAYPGVFEATGADRVSTLIEAAGGVAEGGSLRSVRVSRAPLPDLAGRDSDRDPAFDPAAVTEFDLLRWYVSGDVESNPLVRPGWIIEVRQLFDKIRVRGPVNGRSVFPQVEDETDGNRPKESPDLALEWKEGDRFREILELAGGVSVHAAPTAHVQRADGSEFVLDLEADLDLDRLTLPGDVLEVAHAGRWVFVSGACEAPGRFPYYPGYRAQDYVSLAGGPTEIGRTGGWKLVDPAGRAKTADPNLPVTPGMTILVTERRSYKLARVLAPLTSAAALAISIIALSGR